MKGDLICKCGHLKIKHTLFSEFSTFNDQCQECIDYKKPLDYSWLHIYKPDNLKYLEHILQQKENSNV